MGFSIVVHMLLETPLPWTPSVILHLIYVLKATLCSREGPHSPTVSLLSLRPEPAGLCSQVSHTSPLLFLTLQGPSSCKCWLITKAPVTLAGLHTCSLTSIASTYPPLQTELLGVWAPGRSLFPSSLSPRVSAQETVAEGQRALVPFTFSRSQAEAKTPACPLLGHLASQWQRWRKSQDPSPELLRYSLSLGFPLCKMEIIIVCLAGLA